MQFIYYIQNVIFFYWVDKASTPEVSSLPMYIVFTTFREICGVISIALIMYINFYD